MKIEEYQQFVVIFQKLLNYYPDEKKLQANMQPKFVDEKVYITEEDIINNLHNIFGKNDSLREGKNSYIGYDQPQLGRLLYIYMSGGYDKFKISLSQFIKCFLMLMGEDAH